MWSDDATQHPLKARNVFYRVPHGAIIVTSDILGMKVDYTCLIVI